jgi:hypothetical protein
MHMKFDRKTCRERPLRRLMVNEKIILKKEKKIRRKGI